MEKKGKPTGEATRRTFSRQYAHEQLPSLMEKLNSPGISLKNLDLTYGELVRCHMILGNEQTAMWYIERAEAQGLAANAWYWFGKVAESRSSVLKPLRAYHRISVLNPTFGFWLLGDFHERRGNKHKAAIYYACSTESSKGTNVYRDASRNKLAAL